MQDQLWCGLLNDTHNLNCVVRSHQCRTDFSVHGDAGLPAKRNDVCAASPKLGYHMSPKKAASSRHQHSHQSSPQEKFALFIKHLLRQRVVIGATDIQPKAVVLLVAKHGLAFRNQ